MTKRKSNIFFPPTYDHNYFTPIHSIEDRHFWFQARNRLIGSILKRIIGNIPKGYKVLEVGCGTGNVLKVIQNVCDQGVIFGVDLFRSGLTYAHEEVNCSLIQADLYSLPFTGDFNIIGMFDVLEHLSNDLDVLRIIHKYTAGGGYLLITVPAYPKFWSYFDIASHHIKRYLLGDLKHILEKSGFSIEFITYYMAPIFPLIWLTRKISPYSSQIERKKDPIFDLTMKELRIVPGVNNLILWTLTQEVKLINRGYHLPFGTSILAIARKM